MTVMDSRNAVHGPYQTFMDVDTEIDRFFFADDPGHPVRSAVEVEELTHQMLLDTLRRSGVVLGDYEREVADLLGVLDAHLVQVLCAWIERANLGAALAEVVRLRRELTFTQLLAVEARLRVTRCAHDGCVETGLRPVGTSYACELHHAKAGV